MAKWGRSVGLILFILIFAVRAAAQGGATGAITGVVQDKSGGWVVGAKVVAINEGTKEALRSEVTDSSGVFTMTLLPAGNYTIQITAAGFADTKATGVAVRVTETTRLTIALQLKSITQSVEVSADVFTIRTSDATTGESLVASTISELPLATQNFQQLLSLSAGASSSLNSASQLGRGAVSMNVNGGRDDNNNYQIEGIGANDNSIGELNNTPLPSPDVIQEFKVGTSLYDATQGRNGGGNINAILKTGTANYHFDVFEFFRNTVLDANDFFLNRAGLPRPVIKQNIFGASGGGPVISGGKLGYFFVNYQGTRQRSGDSPGTFISTQIPILPLQRDAASLAAAFSTPATANCPALTLTASQIDPVAQKLLSVQSGQFGPGTGGGWLIPSLVGTPGVTSTFDPVSNTCSANINTAPLVVSSPGKFTDNQFTTNWDKEFHGGKDRISFRFFWSDSEQFLPFGADSFQIQTGGVASANNLNFPLDIPLHDRFGGITETHTFTTALINEFRFGATVISYHFGNVPIVTVQQLGINRPTNNGTSDIYRFSLASFQIGPYPTQLQTSLGDSLSYEDTLSYTLGKHTLRFGGEFDRTTLRRTVPVADNGLLFFAPTASGTVPTTTPAVSDFQYFLQGQPFLSDASSGLANHDYHIPSLGLFAQDDFRATQRLTLNLGLRNEIIGAPVDQFCHIGNVDPSLAAPTGQPFFYPKCVNKFNLPGLVGSAQPSGLDNNWTHVWEPRIGFAYDIGGHHTTSLRGGYGIYSVREDIGAVDNMSFSPPFLPTSVPVGVPPLSLTNLFQGQIPPLGQLSPSFVPSASIFQGFPANCTLANGQPSTDPTQCSPNYSGNVIGTFGLMVPRKWIAPTLQQWNLTLERSLGHGWVVDVGYIGTHGLHLRETSDRNLATLASPQNPVVIKGISCDGKQTGPGQQCTITQNTATNQNARAPFPGLAPGAYEAFVPDANSHYHALQATLIHRFGNGLYLQSAYTWSKSIDDTSTASVAFDTRFNNENDPRATRGPSDFDHTHRSITSFAYEEPFFKNHEGVAGHLLRDWIFSGVLTLQSGQPFTVIDSQGGSAVGPSSPNLITPVFSSGFTCANSVATGSRLDGYLVTAAFQPAPAVGPDGSTGYGNVGRNCYRGPWQKNLDFSIARIFKFGEHQTLKFGADFFNFTNTPSFAGPTITDIHSAAAGASTFAPLTSTVGTPRLVQFALRYAF
ncbi:MAG TPA: carboxypeptidase regulatory-like domain-containing protein [Candidatus Acidoferrum sp.]|nr:carboxypeptidase regulatory-like domain-containing protein [Candidatus Acidoferrum sp.]